MFGVIDGMLGAGESLAILVVKEADGRLRVTARPGGVSANPVLGQGVSVVESAEVLDRGYTEVLRTYSAPAASLKAQVEERVEAVKAAEAAEKDSKAAAVKRIGEASKKVAQGPKKLHAPSQGAGNGPVSDLEGGAETGGVVGGEVAPKNGEPEELELF